MITLPYKLVLFIVANITKEPDSRIGMDVIPFLISLKAVQVFSETRGPENAFERSEWQRFHSSVAT